jgi:hypothetical protein
VYITNNSNSKKQILKVEDNFAKLVEINTDYDGKEHAKFEFSFKVSQLEAIKENAYSVLITIKKPSQQIEPSIVPVSKNGFDASTSRTLINNILTHKTNLLKLNNKLSEDIILTKFADITSKINNHVLSAIKSGNPLDNLGFVTTKLVVKKKDDVSSQGEDLIKNQEIYKREQVNLNERSTRLDLIKNRSTSPSNVSLLGDTTITAQTARSGLLRKDNRKNYAEQLSVLADSYTSKTKIEQTDYKVVIDQPFDEFVDVITPITINDLLSLSSTSVIITFELIKKINKKNGGKDTVVLDKIDKSLNLLSLIGNMSSADSPKINLSFNDNQVTIHTQHLRNKSQLSSSETTIQIHKKSINEDLSQKYELVTTRNIKNDELNQAQKIKYPHFSGETSVYRVSILGSTNFSDIVFKSPQSKSFSKLIVIPILNESSINVVVINNNLTDVVAARLLYRDVTTKQKNFLTLNSLVEFSDFNKIGSFYLRNLIPYHVYEFTTKLIFKNGTEKMSNYSSFLENVPFLGNLNVSISNLLITTDVQFLINSETLQDQVGLLSTLISQTVGTYDLTAFIKRPADLDRFIAFNIVRYNLNNGSVDNLGIVANNTTFLDSLASLRNSCPQLVKGHAYKYVIYPLVRKPDDVLLESIDVVDPETRKSYKLNPRKHRHPLSLIKGRSVTKEFLDNDHKDDMLYGSLGISTQVDVTILSIKPTIKSLSTSYLDNNRLMLNWMIDGDQSDIDHFVIFREIDGVKSIIGNSHCLSGVQNYIYKLSNHDLGNIRFSLLPIYHDYSSGTEFVSNYILIS